MASSPPEEPATVITSTELPSRAALRRARRVCIKSGTSVVANANGRPSLTRLGAIAEQIAELVNDNGVQVIFVSSGAVGMGKRLLRKQARLSMSFKQATQEMGSTMAFGEDEDLMSPPLPGGSELLSGVHRNDRSFVSLLDTDELPHTSAQKKKHYDSACAAAGQYIMMNLYESLFGQCDVAASQLLVTQQDFCDPARLQNTKYAIERLLSLGIVPILNENDAVSGNTGYTPDDVFSDNDSLAALCARHFGAEVLLLLTDVEGVYDRPPSEPDARLLPYYRNGNGGSGNGGDSNDSSNRNTIINIGAKSAQGRGGMGSKIDAAKAAVRPGSRCRACVVASGRDLDCIRAVLGRGDVSANANAANAANHNNNTKYGQPPRGTLFCTPGSDMERQALLDLRAVSSSASVSGNVGSSGPGGEEDVSQQTRDVATRARTEARKLQSLPYAVRQAILRAVADALLRRKEEILQANARDVEAAETDGIAEVLKKRLKLTDEKLATLAVGLRQIADLADPLGVVKAKRELADGLELSQITVPIGVLMIIFESRPDSMPQIAALALASGNGLMLKGGKEAVHSNAAIHAVIGDAIERGSDGAVSRDIIALVTSRGQVKDLLALDDVIDLVIPRGSNALVSYIKANTRIPVLGHADGVCHVYIDASADAESAIKIAVDAKTDYPSACNAMETLLIHEDAVQNGVAGATLMALRAAGVKCLGGPAAMKMGLCDNAAEELKCEYGNLTTMVEIVKSLDEAIDWIHTYSSSHTEAIVCSKDSPAGEEFLRRVDAACVFKNASTRFADGYRFGLGAEVGISTGRIHARGPVGVEGLLTTKWQLRSSDGTFAVAEFAGAEPSRRYTHKELM